MSDSYTERLFNHSLEEIRELHAKGMTVREIAEKVDLSEHLVQALVDRFVIEWDHYSALPSVNSYKDSFE